MIFSLLFCSFASLAEIKTQKGSNKCLFILTQTHNMHIFLLFCALKKILCTNVFDKSVTMLCFDELCLSHCFSWGLFSVAKE